MSKILNIQENLSSTATVLLQKPLCGTVVFDVISMYVSGRSRISHWGHGPILGVDLRHGCFSVKMVAKTRVGDQGSVKFNINHGFRHGFNCIIKI